VSEHGKAQSILSRNLNDCRRVLRQHDLTDNLSDASGIDAEFDAFEEELTRRCCDKQAVCASTEDGFYLRVDEGHQVGARRFGFLQNGLSKGKRNALANFH